MKAKIFKLPVLICMILVLIALAVFTYKIHFASSASTNSFDVSVDINIKVNLSDNVKNVNPNIIKAARAALFGLYRDSAKFAHYNEYKVNEQMNIFEVKEAGKDVWEVRFHGKDNDGPGYSLVTVNKEASGSYVGYIHHSSPLIKGDETF